MSVIIAGNKFALGERLYLHSCSYLVIRVNVYGPISSSLILVNIGGELTIAYRTVHQGKKKTFTLIPMCDFRSFITSIKSLSNNWELAGTTSEAFEGGVRFLEMPGYDVALVTTGYIKYLCDREDGFFKIKKNMVDLLAPGMFAQFKNTVMLRPYPSIDASMWPFVQHLSEDEAVDRLKLLRRKHEKSIYVLPTDIDAIERYLLLGEKKIRFFGNGKVHGDTTGKDVIVIAQVDDRVTLLA